MSPQHRRPPQNPRDPAVARLVQMARHAGGRRTSRRGLLAGVGGTALAGLLAGCGIDGPAGAAGGQLTPAADRSEQERLVRWSNWTLYLDYDDETGAYPTLEAFMDSTGLEVQYSEDIDSNDGFYGRYQNQLSAGQDVGADIVTLTDWMAGRLVRQGVVQDLDLERIPNAKNLLSSYRDVPWDRGRSKSLTWQGGFTGLAWNKQAVPQGLKTLDDLWDPSLKGRVVVLDEMQDTMCMLMLADGVDVSGDWGDAEFYRALEKLEQLIADGQIRQVKGNAYKEDLVSGDALAVIGWSGDLTQLNFENGDRWGFALPESGGLIWADNMLVPMGAAHKANAEQLMDYYYEPAVAAEVAAYVNYICPVQGAAEHMEQIDPALAADRMIFPSEDVLKDAHNVRVLEPDEETKYNEAFQRAIGN